MTRRRHRPFDFRAGLFLALAALVLSLRVVGAGMLAPPVAGYAAICTGAEIVYLPLDPSGEALGEPVSDPQDKAPDARACPWFGLAQAILPDPPALLPRPAPARRAEAPSLSRPAPFRPFEAFEPRAPPRPV